MSRFNYILKQVPVTVMETEVVFTELTEQRSPWKV